MNIFEPSDHTKKKNLMIIDAEDDQPNEDEEYKSEDESAFMNSQVKK